MRTLHIIMPMAGNGSRFSQSGWVTPKPLIEIGGKPLFWRSANSLETLSQTVPTKYTFIVRKEHLRYNIEKSILSYFPQAALYFVDLTTRGAVETCLKAESVILDEDAILVLDCDLEFKSDLFLQMILHSLNTPAEEAKGGILLSFNSQSPKYSYAVVDGKGGVLRTAEKEVVSSHALCGAYYFCSGRSFKNVAHQLMKDVHFNKPEFYISLLYNYLIRAGEPVRISTVNEYFSYGTPEEIGKYL